MMNPNTKQFYLICLVFGGVQFMVKGFPFLFTFVYGHNIKQLMGVGILHCGEETMEGQRTTNQSRRLWTRFRILRSRSILELISEPSDHEERERIERQLNHVIKVPTWMIMMDVCNCIPMWRAWPCGLEVGVYIKGPLNWVILIIDQCFASQATLTCGV